MKLIYVDTSEDDYFDIFEKMKVLKDQELFTEFEIEQYIINHDEFEHYADLLNHLASLVNEDKSVLLLDRRLTNLAYDGMSVEGNKLWLDLRKLNPFIQAYVITSDTEYVDDMNDKGFQFVYDRENFKVLLTQVEKILHGQVEQEKIMNDIIKYLKNEDKISPYILGLETLLADIEGKSIIDYDKIELIRQDNNEIKDLNVLINEVIKKLNED